MLGPKTNAPEESLGDLLYRARIDAGISFGQLAKTTGIARSVLHRLENNQIKKADPAKLALLAEPLNLSLGQLYAAAGYSTPMSLSRLGSQLEAKLAELPPEALERLDAYISELAHEHGITLDADEPADA